MMLDPCPFWHEGSDVSLQRYLQDYSATEPLRLSLELQPLLDVDIDDVTVLASVPLHLLNGSVWQ